jgi:hypothetical protein
MRADEVGAAFRRDRGEVESGADEGSFLDGLASGIATRRRSRRRRIVLGAVVAFVGVTAGAALLGGDDDVARSETEVVRDPPVLRSDPDAAILLESARLRLDGFGDPAAAAPRLRAVTRLYPETREARDALALLRRHGTGEAR